MFHLHLHVSPPFFLLMKQEILHVEESLTTTSHDIFLHFFYLLLLFFSKQHVFVWKNTQLLSSSGYFKQAQRFQVDNNVGSCRKFIKCKCSSNDKLKFINLFVSKP